MLLASLFICACLCKENAVILILCRNEEQDGIRKTLENFEERFNKHHHYPYVFLNDKEFTEEFKAVLSKTTHGTATFGKVDPEMWDVPAWIDRGLMQRNGQAMLAKGVPYASMESYHSMCRFFSRSFYKHPLVQKYDYYWRIEPNVRFRCDIEDDPFEYLKKNNKKYGFVITIREFMESIPTLMPTTAMFLRDYYDELPANKNLLSFMFNNGEYNGCHFWSNFEIASFEFLRSKEYNKYVDALENAGGFYYERWGDAPVHSLAAAMLLDKKETHFFDKIGYTHDAITHCPKDGKNCDCNAGESIDTNPYSCLREYLQDISK